LAHFFARLLANGSLAKSHGANFHGVAAFREQAIGHDLLGQIADDHFHAARFAVNRDRASDLCLAAVQRHRRDAPVDVLGSKRVHSERCNDYQREKWET
jgi:hypothetical protein